MNPFPPFSVKCCESVLHVCCLEFEKPLINIAEYVLYEHHVDVVSSARPTVRGNSDFSRYWCDAVYKINLGTGLILHAFSGLL